MLKTLLPRLLHLARIDQAVAYTLLNRAWMLGANALTMLLVVHFFSGERQGLYFTFLTLLGLHVVFDFGVSFTITQWAARARAHIEEPPHAAAARVADGPAKTRLALLSACAARQVALLAAVFLGFTLCLGGWLFANDTRVPPDQWLVPWVLATVFTSLRIPLLTVEGILEGLGQVSFVARVRLAGLVAGTLALWAIVTSGGGLYGIVASCALTFLVPALAYGRRYGRLLRDLLATAAGSGHRFSWRREIWPSQWKYGATMLTGFLVTNLFNPAIYYCHGAEAAGRFGLGMSIAQAVAGFMSVWLNCKVPQISLFTAERRYGELQLLFRSIKQSTAVVALLAGAAAMALVGLLVLVDPALDARIPSTATLLVLLAAAVLQQYLLTVAVFARAPTREPLLAPSILVACATPCLLALLVASHGALGAAVSYLLPVLLVSLPFSYVTSGQVAAVLARASADPAPEPEPIWATSPTLPRSGELPFQQHTRRLRRFVRSLRGFYALRYWRGHLKLTRIMAHPDLIGLVRRRPRILFKYLHSNYLAVGLDSACRLAILTHHYASLVRSLPTSLLRPLLAEGLVVWQLPGDPVAVSISLSFSSHDFEGELMFAFRVGDVAIYTMSATLAHGALTGPADNSALLITGLQGGAGQLALIRQATCACADTSPPYLLLAAAQGLVAALGVERIVAVGNARQLAKAAGEGLFDYNRFWTCLGGAPTDDGFYLFPAQLPEKPPPAIPSGHRSREARKRDLKRSVAEAVVDCLRQGTPSPPTPQC
jgi:uncharacterized protein VirK/YbjX